MGDDKRQMSLLRIVQRLWGHVYDLLFLIKGTGKKDLETIEMELDLTEYYCRPYAQDDEILASYPRLTDTQVQEIKDALG